MLLVVLMSTSPNSIAGWKIPGTGGICIGFGCEGEPKIGSEWVKQRWEDLGQTPKSVTKICQHVGTSCLDVNFINIYQLLRVGQYSGVYHNVNDCAATGFTMSEGGHKAAQYIALAKGVALPNEFVAFSQAMADQHIVGACEVLFGAAFSQNSISYVDKGVYTTKGNENSIRNAIKKKTGNGFPSGYGMKVCGCWGANPQFTASEPKCASGQVKINICKPNFCAPKHPSYAYVCK